MIRAASGYAHGVGWLSRTNARTREDELRTSWPRAFRRALLTAVTAALAGALFSLALGRPWGDGAFVLGLLGFVLPLATRVVVLWEAKHGLRDR